MSKVSVEFGHTYIGDGLYIRGGIEHPHELSRDLTPFEQTCRIVGNRIAEIGITQGLEVQKHTLVDNVESAFAQSKSVSEQWRYAALDGRVAEGARLAYDVDSVYFEGSLAHAATQSLRTIRERTGKNGSHIPLKTRVGDQRVRLTGFKEIEDKTHPSCDMLDLAWHKKRGEEADILVTVLHESYLGQQARVHALAEHIADDPDLQFSAASVFLHDDGQPAQLVRWTERSPGATHYFDMLQWTLIGEFPNGGTTDNLAENGVI